VGTKECEFEFKMYYRTMNVTLSTVISKADVTIFSECVKMDYPANLNNIWYWDDTLSSTGATISEEAVMELGFTLE
jgi:hypothetical protein